jgi:hypothetical protein
VPGADGAQDLAVDSSGGLGMLVTYAENGKTRVGYTKSHDGGDNFMQVIPVSAPEASVSAQAESSPTLAKIPTAIYALWEQKGPGGTNDLMLGRSLSYGHSFDPPVHVRRRSDRIPRFLGGCSGSQWRCLRGMARWAL